MGGPAMMYVYADLCVDENEEYVPTPVEPLPDDTFAYVVVAPHVLQVWTWDDMTMH